jgi:hypothetical protein
MFILYDKPAINNINSIYIITAYNVDKDTREFR